MNPGGAQWLQSFWSRWLGYAKIRASPEPIADLPRFPHSGRLVAEGTLVFFLPPTGKKEGHLIRPIPHKGAS
jgi:hypothetical protein